MFSPISGSSCSPPFLQALLYGLKSSGAPDRTLTMRQYLFLPSLILPAVLFYMPTSGVTEVDRQGSSLLQHEDRYRAVHISSVGIERPIVSIKKEEPSVRFVNNSLSSVVTVTFDEGALSSECPASAASMNAIGTFHPKTPIDPEGSVSICFLNPGTYNYTVHGILPGPQGLRGSIVVE